MLPQWMTYSDLSKQETVGTGSPVSVPKLRESGRNGGGCALQSVAGREGQGNEGA